MQVSAVQYLSVAKLLERYSAKDPEFVPMDKDTEVRPANAIVNTLKCLSCLKLSQSREFVARPVSKLVRIFT